MKNLLTCLACCLLIFLSHFHAAAQTGPRKDRYEGSLELYVGNGRGQIYSNPVPIGFQVVNSCRLHDKFSLGLGLGLMTDRLWPEVLPLFLDARYYFVNSAFPVRPVVQLGLGYGLVGRANGQLGFGIKIAGPSQIGVLLMFGVRMQSTYEELYARRYIDNWWLADFRLGFVW